MYLFITALLPTSVVSKTQEPSPIPQPSPTPPVTGANTTCAVLAKLAADAEVFKCTSDTTKPCDTVSCSFQIDYSTVIVLLPCVTPTSFQLVISDGNKVLLNKTVDRSQQIPVPELFGLVLNVTLNHFEEAIGLKVSVCVFFLVHTIAI